MAKRIKNWDKLNNNHIGYGGTFYEIKTNVIMETDTESEYNFGIYDLRQLVLLGKLVITQSSVTNMVTGQMTNRDEYVLKLRTQKSTNLVMQHMVMEEIMMNLDLFKTYLRDCCQRMLKQIEETNKWKIQNGYTT